MANRLNLFCLALIFLLASVPIAQADPVSIGIAIITAAETVSGVAIGFEAASFVGYIAIGALVTGAQFALNALTKKPSIGSGINDQSVHSNVQQSSPSQHIVYGETLTGGAVSWLDTDTAPYLFLQLLISSRRISAFLGVRLGAVDVPFAGVTNNTVMDPQPTDGQFYWLSGTSRLKACFRDGDPDQLVDALLAANYPTLDANFRARGIATASFRFSYGTDRTDFEKTWGQVSIPSPQLLVRGATVYDPRDPTQDRDDERSWKYSNNATLIQTDWLRQPYGINFPAENIDWIKTAISANYDDELVGNADGTFSKRHTIDGVVTLNQSPRTIMESMLTANAGILVQSKGSAWIQSSMPLDPVMTITDGMMTGGFEFQDDKQKRDLVNSIRTRITSSDREYQEIDGPPLKRDDLIADDGEELSQTLDLPFTSDQRTAQRLSKQFLEQSRLPRALTCVVKLNRKTLELDLGDCVRVYSRIFSRLNTTYTVADYAFLDDFSGIHLSLAEYDKTIPKNWVASVDEKPFTLPAVTS